MTTQRMITKEELIAELTAANKTCETDLVRVAEVLSAKNRRGLDRETRQRYQAYRVAIKECLRLGQDMIDRLIYPRSPPQPPSRSLGLYRLLIANGCPERPAHAVLRANKYQTPEDLMDASDEELISIRSIGVKGREQILSALNRMMTRSA